MFVFVSAQLFEVSNDSQSSFLPASNTNTYRCGFFVRSDVRFTVYKGGNFCKRVSINMQKRNKHSHPIRSPL